MPDENAAGNGNAAPDARNAAGAVAGVLQRAVARGVITDDQRRAILALDDSASMVRETPGTAGGEAPRGFNLVTAGYWAGGTVVLFALGWFLVDRWQSLRPGGVLLVALLYALAFAMSSFLFSRLGFRVASGLMLLLTVGMTPVVVWSIEALFGIWPTGTVQRGAPFTTDVMTSVRWIPLELSAALAGLLALRKVRFDMLALTIAIPCGLTLVHLTPWLFDPDLATWLSGWMALLAFSLLTAAGYAVQRRTSTDDEDYATWVYLTALAFLVFGFLAVANQSRVIPHSLPALVTLLVILSFAFARRGFLLVAAGFFIGYLGFLAGSVFKSAVAFMLVMGAVGALVILLTVLTQRRFGAAMHRLSADRGRPQPLRATRLLLSGMVVVALAMVVAAVPHARDQRSLAEQRRAIRQAGELRRARQAPQRAPRSAAQARGQPAHGETPAHPRP